MEKIEVKTTGKFMLFDPQTGAEIGPDPVTVPKSHFVTERLEAGQLKATGKAKEEPAKDPLDHDGDGKKGGSLPKGKKAGN